jgi:DUF1680 family protein
MPKVIIDTSKSPYAKLDSIGLNKINICDLFWKPKIDINYKISLSHQYKECERTGRIDNFRIASGLKKGKITKFLGPDSDVYKWLEAFSFTLNTYPNNSYLKSKVDQLVDLIAKAQDKNGYINTSFMLENKKKRWKDFVEKHELYCGGHLIQTAIAHRRATDKNTLFNVAIKWADYICNYFGPGTHKETGGHPEIEMALVELYRETDNKRYLNLAVNFIEQRGKKTSGLHGDIYLQDHLPIRKQTYVIGHAVRQLYLVCGITDIYAETGDKSLINILKKQWDNFVNKKMYITGGAGARHKGESFGLNYELPNRTAYNETCAAIASFMWHWRMLQVTAKACYTDIMEKVLYNGLLSGVSLNGKEYFYINPLEHDGKKDPGLTHPNRSSNKRTTKHWDRTPCCPPNAARILASLPGYIYGKNKNALYIHHYMANSAEIEIKKTKIKLIQKTNYPWDGKIKININPEKKIKFNLFIRIPGWTQNPKIKIKGQKFNIKIIPGTYLKISRLWLPNDTITLEFPMPIVRITSNPKITNNNSCIALMRGPVVYCIEEIDHKGIDIFNIILPRNSKLKYRFKPTLLGGIVTIEGNALLTTPLDKPYFKTDINPGKQKTIRIKAIPYFSWANRKEGAMRVWISTC